MEAFITPFPSIADSTMAERIPGKAIMASTPLLAAVGHLHAEGIQCPVLAYGEADVLCPEVGCQAESH